MREFFEKRKLTGAITLTLSNKEKWSKDKGELCKEIVGFIDEYLGAGYRLTLRQLYYRLVASGAIRNDDVVYKKISSVLDDLRYSGRVDWDAIEDRGRVPNIPYFVESVDDAIRDTIGQYRLDRQKGQKTLIEVWTEKDAISGILKRVTHKYHVRLVVNKGYSSSSAMHLAYERFSEALNAGRDIKILYFGDHDPSGLDMVRDINDRALFFITNGKQVLDPMIDSVQWSNWQVKSENFWDAWGREKGLFTFFDFVDEGMISEDECNSFIRAGESWELIDNLRKRHYWATRFEVIHVGLTTEQVKKFTPPPNPAKISDPRSKWYIEKFGDVSWEVDALKPETMVSLVDGAISQLISNPEYNKMLSKEKSDIVKLKSILEK